MSDAHTRERPLGRCNAQQPEIDDRNRTEHQSQTKDVSRFDQRKQKQRIANPRGKAGRFERLEKCCYVHQAFVAGDQEPQTWS